MIKGKDKAKFGWIIPCNPRYYDVIGAFSNLNKIEWKQSTNIKVGDIVYIYVSSPYKEIKFKCIARKVDMVSAGRIDDSKYILDDTNYKNYGRYMELELVKKYKNNQYPFEIIKQKGVKAIQGPSRITEELNYYIKLLEVNEDKVILDNNDNADHTLIREINLSTASNIEDNRYEYTIKSKREPIIQNGVKVYPRDRKESMKALVCAKYLCEINNNHDTFISRNTGNNYTEPHHLIPMAYSDLFDVSLDVKENIVSLCSNCHNKIHYGRGYEEMLRKLYDERSESLKKVGLYVTFEELLEMYS